MPRPIQATLHLAAFENNLHVVRRYTPTAKVWSVIKANAYGHGIARIWRSLAQTDGFALLDFDEAILLREAGWQGPILLLEGFFNAQDLSLVDRYRLTTVVHSKWQLEAIAKANLTAPLDIYLKLNSGMQRLGFTAACLHELVEKVKSIKNIASLTLMSHFASADKQDGIQHQMDIIENATMGLPLPSSLANSAAVLWHPATHKSWVRPGIILYGASPTGCWNDIADTGLQATMTLSSEIIAVQHLEKGDRVGYGGIYAADTHQRIGIVACGYADGYPRSASIGTPVWAEGILTHTVGMISMDMLAIDLTPYPQLGIGTQVELWGKHLPVDIVASAAGTLGYELLTALAKRVPVIIEE